LSGRDLTRQASCLVIDSRCSLGQSNRQAFARPRAFVSAKPYHRNLGLGKNRRSVLFLFASLSRSSPQDYGHAQHRCWIPQRESCPPGNIRPELVCLSRFVAHWAHPPSIPSHSRVSLSCGPELVVRHRPPR